MTPESKKAETSPVLVLSAGVAVPSCRARPRRDLVAKVSAQRQTFHRPAVGLARLIL